MRRGPITYKSSGVDVSANTVWVRKIQSAMVSTHGPQVLGSGGAFAGMFSLANGEAPGGPTYRRPVLVGCADGVGTKVLLGIKAGRLGGLGVDLVAMNVNDLVTCGAKPLFFLDYLAVNKLDPEVLLSVVEGVADGCRQSGCALLGGETAEMPDLYRRGEFDLAGFAVGIVEKPRLIDGANVSPGDVLIGLPSSGVHSNGFSLVRRLIARRRLRLDRCFEELGETLADAVLRPTKIYVDGVLAVLNSLRVRTAVTAMAHITGGGLVENVARAAGPKCDAVIEVARWQPPPIFAFLQKQSVTRREMFRVFNMGIGYVLIVQSRRQADVLRVLERKGESPSVIGHVKRGAGKVVLR